MADDADKKIAKIQKKLDALEKKLDRYIELFVRNEDISDNEEAALNRVRTQIETQKEKIVKINAKRGIYILDEIEVITDTKKEYGDAKNFNDDYFKGAFNGAIKNWTQDAGIKINSVRPT